MKRILLIDFGSTYTKLCAVDAEREEVLGTAQSYTTVEEDIGIGLEKAKAKLFETIGPMEFDLTLACSSAAGGLRMATCGLVPELTGEAARLASLGAGAKVVGVYAFELTREDVAEIAALSPDIFLLVGGTDGGNSRCILHNAKMLAEGDAKFPIIVAGNRSAAEECKTILAGREVYLCPNVMPKFGVLKTDACRDRIREIFLKKIIDAKGIRRAGEEVADVIMPTPSAVMAAMELLSKGCEGEAGVGDLICVDVGGATTDIYSMTDGMPEGMNTVFKGLPEPWAKRTVEGDIGMRYSAHGVLEAVGMNTICALSGLSPEKVEKWMEAIRIDPSLVPDGNEELEKLDFALAASAVRCAVTRHAGTLTETYTMMGQTWIQEGKNLSRVSRIVVTGGSLIYAKDTEKIAAFALASPDTPHSLRPKKASVLVDKSYIIAAMGLLSAHDPRLALRIMKKELKEYGDSE